MNRKNTDKKTSRPTLTPTSTVSSPWLRLHEAARYCGGVSEKTVRGWIGQGLQVARIGGLLMFRIDWLDEWLAAHISTGNEVGEIVDSVLNDLTDSKNGRVTR